MFPGGYCAGLGVGGWLLMIGFWGALIAVVVWAVIRLFPSSPSPGASASDQPADQVTPPEATTAADATPHVGAGRR